VIDSITITPARAEFRSDAVIEAVARDKETPADRLRFEWTASLGAFSGTGRRVTWRLDNPPLRASPVTVQVGLTVFDEEANASIAGTLSASRLFSFILNDSYKEATDLVNAFLTDFTNSAAAPSFVVRNFSDNCRGKADELNDVTRNRELYTIRSGVWSVNTIRVDGDLGDVTASCTFVSTVKATGRTETARGTCLFNTVYEKDRWYLCDSRFAGSSVISLQGFHR
jgi:hypothetical protein